MKVEQGSAQGEKLSAQWFLVYSTRP
jgi:hypothetical protein